MGAAFCYFRVTPVSEVIQGAFNTKRGIVVEYPELLAVDVSKLTFEELTPTTDIARKQWLAKVLFETPLALAVIDYDGVAAIVVTNKGVQYMYQREDNTINNNSVCTAALPSARKFKHIGFVKTKTLNICVAQPVGHLSVFRENGSWWSVTQEGVLKLMFEPDDVKGTFNMSRYIEMCTNKEAKGVFLRDGVPRLCKVSPDNLSLVEIN